MTLLKDYINTVDYFVCPETLTPPSFYQKYKQILYLNDIKQDDIDIFKNKIIYIFFSSIDEKTLTTLCSYVKSVYFINTSTVENIRLISALSSKNNLHSFLTNYDKDGYIDFLNSLKE